MRRLATRLWRDRCGGALVEFAIFAPLMLVVLIGFAEGVQMMEAHGRIARAASTVADLATQEHTLTDDQVNDMFLAGTMVVEPLPTGTLGMRLMAFSADANGVAKKDWTANAARSYAGTAPDTLPAGYTLRPNQGVVVADVSYAYQPAARWILPTDIRMQKRMLLRPRNADKVTKS